MQVTVFTQLPSTFTLIMKTDEGFKHTRLQAGDRIAFQPNEGTMRFWRGSSPILMAFAHDSIEAALTIISPDLLPLLSPEALPGLMRQILGQITAEANLVISQEHTPSISTDLFAYQLATPEAA